MNTHKTEVVILLLADRIVLFQNRIERNCQQTLICGRLVFDILAKYNLCLT